MGVSPAAQNEVLLVFGSLMVFFAVLALMFAGIQWVRRHPGVVRYRITAGLDFLKNLVRRITARFYTRRIPHSL